MPPELTPLRITSRRGVEVFAPGAVVVIGRDSSSSVVLAHDKVSRQHLTIQFDAAHGWIAKDGSSNGTFRNGQRITEMVITAPVSLALGSAVDGEQIELAPAPTTGILPSAGSRPALPSVGNFSMVYEPVKRTRIGRAPDNDIVVNDLLASRYHAELSADGRGGWTIEDLHSFNGTFINGHRITRKVAVADGAVISVAHHLFVLVNGRLEEYLDDGRIRLTALNLSVVAGKQRLLEDVSFHLAQNSLLAVLGPTGAGKSTMMRALTGWQQPATGSVLYNGRDLYAAYDELRYRIGYVPQDDVLHRELSVRKALSYAAALRFPPDVSADERHNRVEEVMAELGLSGRAGLSVSRLSGGQRKRTSVALELLTSPSLLSLDEPTSGLDPGYERQVMTLLRDLSRAGRTVITVTHNTESLDLCDRVLFLAPGGQVAYFGPPAEAREHFGTDHYPEVFIQLEEAPSGQAKQRFAESSKAKQYLTDPVQRQLETAPFVPPATTAPSKTQVPRPARQLMTMTRRYTNIIFSDARNTLLLLIQAPILGLLMMATMGSDGLVRGEAAATGGGTVLLALILGATYLGGGNAIREIVKERAILFRESAAGLSPGAYLGSKVIVLGTLTAVQAVILVLLGTLNQGGPGEGVILSSGKVELMIVTTLAGWAAMALGLLISAFVSNPDKALTILPVILLAQFLLSGVFFSLPGPVMQPLSYLTSARWGFAAAASTSDLRALSTVNCTSADAPIPGTNLVNKSQEGTPACDRWRLHDARTWYTDTGMIVVLTILPLIGAWIAVRRVGRAKR